jgi:Ca2+-binding RTX toxin-like protein
LNRAGDDQLVSIEKIDASNSLSGVLINLAIQTETLSINGGNFSDTITGGSGADSLIGGAGADSFIGFDGADSLDGGDGTADTLRLTTTSADLNGATDSQLVNIEVIDASASTLGVLININSQSDSFQIVGGSSADSIVGGSGADSLTGGAGADSLSGGAGADYFLYSNLTDSLAGNSLLTAGDTINDFLSGTDKFDVSAASLSAITGANGLLSGLAYTAIGTADLSDDIATAIGAGGGTLLANGAAVVTVTGGLGAGTYLVLNNSTAGYSASDDAVILLGAGYSSTVSTGDFV